MLMTTPVLQVIAFLVYYQMLSSAIPQHDTDLYDDVSDSISHLFFRPDTDHGDDEDDLNIDIPSKQLYNFLQQQRKKQKPPKKNASNFLKRYKKPTTTSKSKFKTFSSTTSPFESMIAQILLNHNNGNSFNMGNPHSNSSTIIQKFSGNGKNFTFKIVAVPADEMDSVYSENGQGELNPLVLQEAAINKTLETVRMLTQSQTEIPTPSETPLNITSDTKALEIDKLPEQQPQIIVVMMPPSNMMGMGSQKIKTQATTPSTTTTTEDSRTVYLGPTFGQVFLSMFNREWFDGTWEQVQCILFSICPYEVFQKK